MAGSVWVLAEQWKGQISEITYETLALGRELAIARKTDLQAVLLGHEVRDLARTLGAADSVIHIDHAALATPVPELFARALTAAIQAKDPEIVLIPLTNMHWEIGSFLTAELGRPYINACKEVLVVEGGLQVRSVIHGGKMEVILRPAQSCILGVLPGVRPADRQRQESVPPLEELTVDLPEVFPVRFTRFLEPEPGDIDIAKQEVLISVGRGIQSADNLVLAEELAQALGGAVCGSRPVIDQGWLPLSRQVGKSGVIVKPKVYVAVGISGAPEHVEGMKNSELIIAINSDAQAPIFGVAHYGVTAEALDVLPALTEAVQRRKKEVRAHAA